MRQRAKTMILTMLHNAVHTAMQPWSEDIAHRLGNIEADIHRVLSKEGQVALYLAYRDIAARRVLPLPSFLEVGFRCYSQFEEDGILLFLFGVIGTTNKISVEVCAGNGLECMTTNLILNHGWWGHLFDGNEKNVKTGIDYFRRSPDVFLSPPRFSHAWITAENINDVIRASGAEGEIDLLSLDIDGMDYWVWRAIDCISPRVVVCETHNIIGPDDAITVPYDPNFQISIPDYHSASLAAMTALGRQKGYRLVGTHRYGFNAFFVRDGISEDLLPAVTPSSCLDTRFVQEQRAERWPKVKDLKWERVSTE
jgi:hypothetical protein